MEEILAQLLVPDSETIGRATKALQEAFKSSEAIPLLCNVLSTSPSSQIRHYAAVLLRKRLIKAKNWKKLPPETQNVVKTGILPVLMNEQEKSVKVAVVQLIAALAKHELAQGTWPDLEKFLQGLLTSQFQSEVELAMFTMSVLTDVALEVFASNPNQFVILLSTAFGALDDLNTVLGYYTVVTMTHVAAICDTDPELKSIYAKAIPKIMAGLPALAAADEEKAFEVLDFFTEVMSSSMSLLTPHMTTFMQFCLHLAGNKTLGDSIRDRAMTLVGACVRSKKKLIVKLQLVKPIVSVLFGAMCEPPEGGGDPNEDDWFTDEDQTAPFQSATNVMGGIAVYLPPTKVLDAVLEHVSAGLATEDLYVKKGCYLALAIVTEGASECIRNNYLKVFLQCISAGITHHAPVVRNAALFALGQLSEHLQPEISEHAEELMPILFEYLSQLCQRLAKGSPEPPGLYSMFYAIESFCENLEEKLVPYLPMLMERLLSTLQRNHSVNVQELAISSVGCVASSVNTAILPYFPTIMEKLKVYLLEPPTEETECLQVQAIQTLSLIARTLGSEHFLPLAEETATLGLRLLQGSEDPDLKAALYSLFAALSLVLKDDSAAFLPPLIESIFLSLKSTEGVVSTYKEEDGPLSVFEDVADSGDEEDIASQSESSDEPEEFMVENPYMEEKEEACLTLKEFALNAGGSFLPYLEKAFEEVLELTSFPHDDVRKSSFEALAQFCINFSKIETVEGKQALGKALEMVVPQCTDAVIKDEECLVANSALEALAAMLKQIGAPVLAGSGHQQAILKVVNDVLLSKVECQDKGEEDEAPAEGDEGEGEAEQDELLMESAGEVIPALGHAMPAPQFIMCLQALLPAILPKLGKQSSVSQRSFFIGTLAECMSSAGPELSTRGDLSEQLLNLYLPLAQDSNQEVRNNAIFGLGELVLHSKQTLYSKYMDILRLLSNALSTEVYPCAIDNICGALARIILTNHEIVPVDQVLTALVEKLPLKEDYEEHEAMVKCLAHLYQLGHGAIKAHMASVIRICCLILHEKKGNDTILGMTAELLKLCWKDFPAEVTSVVQTLPQEAATNLHSLLTTS